MNTPETKPKSLISKLAEVMAAIDRVPKLGRNEFHRYNYVTEADLAAAVRPLLAERSIMMIPHVKSAVRHEHVTQKGNKSYITDVEIDWIVSDGETGETITFPMPGCGEDTGDKGLYKAITGSEKYALKNLFLIPTGDDPEKDESTRPAPPAPRASKPEPEIPKSWQPGEPGSANEEFIGVLENVEQKADDKNVLWTSGFIDSKRFYTNDQQLGAQMLNYCDCDCTVIATHRKNGYRLLSIK